MPQLIPRLDVRQLYAHFDEPVTALDCGTKCAPHNPSGKPFCCDICHAVPAAYHQEWEYVRLNTDLWHVWRGDECTEDPACLEDLGCTEDPGCPEDPACPEDPGDPADLLAETPDHMLLLACLGPAHCQRDFRLMSCRQFPFFPYVTSNYRFLGLAYEWEFETTCWVISNLGAVTDKYRQAFVNVYDALFAHWQEEFEGYAIRSAEMREHFAAQKRRIPLLHRHGGNYLLSPNSERIQRVSSEHFRRFGPYKTED